MAYQCPEMVGPMQPEGQWQGDFCPFCITVLSHQSWSRCPSHAVHAVTQLDSCSPCSGRDAVEMMEFAADAPLAPGSPGFHGRPPEEAKENLGRLILNLSISCPSATAGKKHAIADPGCKPHYFSASPLARMHVRPCTKKTVSFRTHDDRLVHRTIRNEPSPVSNCSCERLVVLVLFNPQNPQAMYEY